MPPKMIEKPAEKPSPEKEKATAARSRELEAAISSITKTYGEGSIMRLGAAQALRKHRNRAAQIMAKVSAYAADPASLANNVTPLRGEEAKRLRVGDFRVIFTETEADVTILDIGPRGSIYD